MNNPEASPKISSNDGKLKKIGFGLTLVWLAAVAIYAIIAWSDVIAMGPHDLADSLGGVFAPLAFLWLVLGYLQQGEELRHSVEALRLQSVELSHSVEQQRQLVEATREQIAQEREMLAAEEAAAARAAAPHFQMRDWSTSYQDGYIQRDYIIVNSGKPCRNVKIDISPMGILREFSIFGNELSCQIEMPHMKDVADLLAQEVVITYLDERNVRGEQRFVISTHQVPGYGVTWGEPHPIIAVAL